MNTLIDGTGEKGVVVFAHGSGIAMDHSFMQDITQQLVELGLKVVRFEFPYMANRRLTGKKSFPDKVDVLIKCYESVILDVQANILESSQPLYLAGKSLGGRVATMLCEQMNIDKVFVFGYPFHPIKKPKNLRISHLEKMNTDVHIFQGERDKFGDVSEVVTYDLSHKVQVEWIKDGDHDLQPRLRSGVTYQQNLQHIKMSIDSLI